jgi:hypothetical protein
LDIHTKVPLESLWAGQEWKREGAEEKAIEGRKISMGKERSLGAAKENGLLRGRRASSC